MPIGFKVLIVCDYEECSKSVELPDVLLTQEKGTFKFDSIKAANNAGWVSYVVPTGDWDGSGGDNIQFFCCRDHRYLGKD